MSDEISPITVTLKGGAGYEAPWLVIRGNTPNEVATMLRDLGELPSATVEASNLFRGVTTVGPILPNAPQEAPVQQGTVTQGPWGGAPAQPVQSAQPPQWAGAASPQPTAPVAAPAQQIQLHPTDVCQTCGQRPQYKVVNRRTDGKQFKFWTCPNQKSRNDGHYSEFAD